MAYLLQVDFPFEGPFGEEMEKGFWDLAKSINEEEGFHWKIWTENEETKEAGGILFFFKYIDTSSLIRFLILRPYFPMKSFFFINTFC